VYAQEEALPWSSCWHRPVGRGRLWILARGKVSAWHVCAVLASAGMQGDSCRRHVKSRSASQRVNRAVPISLSPSAEARGGWNVGYVQRE